MAQRKRCVEGGKPCTRCGVFYVNMAEGFNRGAGPGGFTTLCKKCHGKIPRRTISRTCRHCKKTFAADLACVRHGEKRGKTAGVYCSRQCHEEGKRISVPCAKCGKEFRIMRCHRHRKYCSKSCAGVAAVTWVSLVCETCGTSYSVLPSRAAKSHCCSWACSTIRTAALLKKNRNESRTRLTTKAWLRKRRQVVRRDGFKCTACGLGFGPLHVHHIVPWLDSRDDAIENLTTLCGPCHAKAEVKVNPRHKYYAGGAPL